MIKIEGDLLISVIEHINLGYISKRKHPTEDLYILNYTDKTQNDWLWNDATKLCRGLIVDGDYNIVARSYKKFFTLDQIEDSGCDRLPPSDEPYEIFHKKDGFLGIMYFVDNEPFIATRGSFESDMAVRATKILRDKYSGIVWNPDYSYIFEIIYPNVILTIDYGYEALVLHGIVDNRTGEEVSIVDYYDTVHMHSEGLMLELPVEIGSSFTGIAEFYKRYHYDDDEGYVIRFKSGYRVKVKFDEYKKLSHAKRAFGGEGTKKLYELCRDGEIEDILDKLPKHTISYRREIVDRIYQEYEDMYTWHLDMYIRVYKYWKDIKSFAICVNNIQSKQYINPSILIKMFKGDYDGLYNGLWKIITDRRKVVSDEE